MDLPLSSDFSDANAVKCTQDAASPSRVRRPSGPGTRHARLNAFAKHVSIVSPQSVAEPGDSRSKGAFAAATDAAACAAATAAIDSASPLLLRIKFPNKPVLPPVPEKEEDDRL